MTTLKRCFGPLATVVLVLLLVGVAPSTAQTDLEKAFKQYNQDQVVGYIQPIADMFGANMMTGFFHNAEIEPSGLHIRLDIIAMGSMIQDAQKNYTLNAPTGFTPATFTAPTVFGGKGTTTTDETTGLTYGSSDGIINASIFPLAAPQLTIGNIYGTQASIRFLTVPKVSDQVPYVTLWSIGARHSISQYLPSVPLDLAAGIYYGKFVFGDYIDYSGLAINAQASKSFSILTVYGGLQWEKSSLNLSYTSTGESTPVVDVTLDGSNKFRFLAGLQLGLGPLKLFGDANFGSVTVLSAGIGFGSN